MVLIVSMWSQGASRNGLFFKRPFGSLCSYPSNEGIGISTWFEGGSTMESRKLVYKVMTSPACMHVTCIKEFQCLPTCNIAGIDLSVGGDGGVLNTDYYYQFHRLWMSLCG